MKHFNSPDTLPTYNYFKLIETGNPAYLLKTNTPSDLNAKQIKFLKNNGKRIWNYIKNNMPPGSFNNKIAREELQLAKYRNLAIRNVAPRFATQAKIQEKLVARLKEKQQAESENKTFELNREIITIETVLGVNINPRKCSISKYMSYRKLTTEKNEAIQRQQNKSREKSR